MKRLGPDVWDDENEEPIRKISDQQIIEDEKLNELQRMVDEANRQFKTNVGDYTGRQQTSEDAWNRALAQEDMDYKRQYAEAMRNADREMENVPLMAEYNTTQRYLDKELGRDPVKRIIMNDRARLGSKVRDLIPEGGMTSSANMSRELDPYQKLIAQKQSLMQPKSTPNVSIQGEGFSEGTNETLRNAVLSTLLAGGAGVAGYGSYKAGSEFAEGFKRGFNRSNSSPIQTFKANEMLDYNPSNRINVDPSVIEAKTSTPLLTQSTPRNARDFSYLNPKAQPIVESQYYKQGLPDIIPDRFDYDQSVDNYDIDDRKYNAFSRNNPTKVPLKDTGYVIGDDEIPEVTNTEYNKPRKQPVYGPTINSSEIKNEKYKPMKGARFNPKGTNPEIPNIFFDKEQDLLDSMVGDTFAHATSPEGEKYAARMAFNRQPTTKPLGGQSVFNSLDMREKNLINPTESVFKKYGKMALRNKGKLATGILGGLLTVPAMAADEILSTEDAGHADELNAIKLMKADGISYEEALARMAMYREQQAKEQENEIYRDVLKNYSAGKFKGREQF